MKKVILDVLIAVAAATLCVTGFAGCADPANGGTLPPAIEDPGTEGSDAEDTVDTTELSPVDAEFTGVTEAVAVLAAIRALYVDDSATNYESPFIDSDWDTVLPDTTSAITIALADGATVATNNARDTDIPGVAIAGNVVTISAEGVYVLSGTLTNGRVVVDVAKNVEIVLAGAHITSGDGAPLAFFGKKKKTVTLAAGTTNSLTDAAVYTAFQGDAADEEPNGALFSKKALTIKGNGSLTITGNYNNGISCKDNLKIMGGTITVSAPNNAVKGKDSLIVKGGTITAVSGDDGFKSDNDEDAGFGYVYIGGGTVDITAGGDGIQAYRALIIEEGADVTVKAGGGATGAANGYDGDASYKGLKSDTDLLITGGTVKVNARDDAIHANHAVLISGGTITASTDDDGIHGDAFVVINGGAITVAKSYEGIEAAKVVLNNGTVKVTASDDGINASDGTSTFPTGGPGGHSGGTGGASNTCALTINGGKITVNAGGDGLDSNGSLLIAGGVIVVHGPTSNGDGALDSDGTFLVEGGTLIAAGPAGMAQKPAAASLQPSAALTFSTNQTAGTKVTVTPSAAPERTVTYTAAKAFKTLVVSAPDFTVGGTITVNVGGGSAKTVTLTSMVTSLNL